MKVAYPRLAQGDMSRLHGTVETCGSLVPLFIPTPEALDWACSNNHMTKGSCRPGLHVSAWRADTAPQRTASVLHPPLQTSLRAVGPGYALSLEGKRSDV